MSSTESTASPAQPPNESLPSSNQASAVPRPWQFLLRDLFWITTIIAVITGLTLIEKSLGAFTAISAFSWLNYRGRFAALQTQRSQKRLFSLAWLLFGISLFLPAMKGCNNKTISGWEAAGEAASVEWEIASRLGKLIVSPDARTKFVAEFGDTKNAFQECWLGVWITVLNSGNLLMILLPVFWWRVRKGEGRWLTALLAVMLLSLLPIFQEPQLIGCYVWCISFAILALSVRFHRSALICQAMFAVPVAVLMLLDYLGKK